ncbi:cation:proton antiporter [Streptomyces parvus]|uniref:cation:proton antiporter n=1 Tax=Streptomyces parvus TaxID=66428 RepID=UPI00081B2C7C|nr:cation:proton antiporter [Streptomyces sp. Termitarium-T10T-6]SCD59098.1 transporter, CPA2 family [Streptomyces sp. Termitarium-T10T-6]
MRGPSQFGQRRWATPALTVAVPLLVIVTATWLVSGESTAAREAAGAEQGLDKGGHFLLAVAVILVAAYVGGLLADRLGQPRVIGEICAGLALGPTALGRFAPGAADWLFPSGILPMLDGLAQVGLVFFMFGVGRELSGMRLRGTGKQALLISQASLLVPFAAGAAAGVPLARAFMGPAGNPVVFVLFVGCALSVTAFPVLARILTDLGLTRTRQGQLSLFAAAVGDGIVWLILTGLLAHLHGSGPAGVLLNGLLAAAITLFFLGPLRTWLARWARSRSAMAEGGESDAVTMVLLATGIAATATLTTLIGVHQLIGALLVGIAWPRGNARAVRVADRLSGTAKTVLLPFFFFGFGLTIDLGALRFDRTAVLALGALLVLAVVTKVFGAALLAVFTGMPRRPALTLGVLLNSRGLTELVILQIGYQAGVIDQRLLTLLTIVALVTTMMTRPLLQLLGPDAIEPAPDAPANGSGERRGASGRGDAPELVSLPD